MLLTRGRKWLKDDIGLCEWDARHLQVCVFLLPWAASAFSASAARGAARSRRSSSLWSLCSSWWSLAKPSHIPLLQGAVVTKPVQELKLLKSSRALWWRLLLPPALFDSGHIMWETGKAWEGLIIEPGAEYLTCAQLNAAFAISKGLQ